MAWPEEGIEDTVIYGQKEWIGDKDLTLRMVDGAKGVFFGEMEVLSDVNITGDVGITGDLLVNGEEVLTEGDLPFFNAKDYASIQAAINAAEAANGGVVVISPGVYQEQLVFNTNKTVRVVGTGATLRASANNQTLVTFAGTLDPGSGRRLEGLRIEGNNFTGVVGIDIINSVNAVVSDIYIYKCNVGLRFSVTDPLTWTEYCGADKVFINECNVGIDYDNRTATTSVSFCECWLSDVGVTQSRIGVRVDEGAQMARVTWRNVTAWTVQEGDVGFKIGGLLDMCRLEFHVESFVTTPTNVVGVLFTPTFTWWADATTSELSASYIGAFSTAQKNDSATGVSIRNGANWRTSGFANQLMMYQNQETYPRLKLDTTGIKLGDGANEPPVSFQCVYGSWVDVNGGQLFFQYPNGHAVAAATDVFTVVGTVEVYNNATRLSAGYLPVYKNTGAKVVSHVGTAVTATINDCGRYLRFSGTNPTYTIPPNSSVPIPVGTQIDGVGVSTAMTIAAGAGVTIVKARTLVTVGAMSGWTLIKINTDGWDLHGDFV